MSHRKLIAIARGAALACALPGIVLTAWAILNGALQSNTLVVGIMGGSLAVAPYVLACALEDLLRSDEDGPDTPET